MTIDEMVASVQTALGIHVDAHPGPETWTSILRAVNGGQPDTPNLDRVDARSERCISTLLREVQPLARALVQKASQHGVVIRVISGTRSFEEQDALYSEGRSAPGPIVTNARGGESNHNYGIAFDVGIFEGSHYLQDSRNYKLVGALGMDLGLSWGGAWKRFVDECHFELRPKWAVRMGETEMIEELAKRKSAGESVFA